jgi:hypothetical protein
MIPTTSAFNVVIAMATNLMASVGIPTSEALASPKLSTFQDIALIVVGIAAALLGGDPYSWRRTAQAMLTSARS